MKRFIWFLLIFVLFGCEDKSFSKVYDESIRGDKLYQVRISVNDPLLKKMLKRALEDENIKVSMNAKYTLEVQSREYDHHCNNPLTASYDATYDGYTKISLMKNMHLIYSIQQDYHGKVDVDILEELIEKMVDDMKLKN